MYLGRIKVAKIKAKDVLEGQLYKGQWIVLWFLSIAGFADPETIALATGYSLKTVKRMYLYPLEKFKLIKRLVFKEPNVKTNFYSLTERGVKKLSLASGIYKQALRFTPKINQIFSEHRLFENRILAYLFRYYEPEKGKGRWSRELFGDERRWRKAIQKFRNRHKKQLEEQYGIGSDMFMYQLKKLYERIKQLPIPDIYVNTGDFGDSFTFIELETGEKRGKDHVREKLERYKEHAEDIEEILNEDLGRFPASKISIIFITNSKNTKETLRQHVFDEKIKVGYVPFCIDVITEEEFLKRLQEWRKKYDESTGWEKLDHSPDFCKNPV